MRYAAVILAAGEASRFGAPKQLLELEGRNFVQRACDLAIAADCSPVIVVLGAHSELVVAQGFPEGVVFIDNGDWQKGMGSSLSVGIKEAALSEVDAALIMLADQPGIRLSTISMMKSAFAESDISIVLCGHENASGPPVLFGGDHFEELSLLENDFGGKSIVRRHRGSVTTISAPEAAWDIDDPVEWAKFQS